MGRAADPWRAAETWIRCLASHSVPLHATAGLSAHPDLAHLPAEPGICNRHDRSWRNRSAIGRASCSRPRMDRASCPVRYEGAEWHPLRVYRAIIDLAPGAAVSLGDGNFVNMLSSHRDFSVAQTRIEPANARWEIDRVLRSCWIEKRPVYLQLPSDVPAMTIEVPEGPLQLTPPNSDPTQLALAIARIATRMAEAHLPIILLDADVARFGLTKPIVTLIEAHAIPFATLRSAKALIDESHELHLGTYRGTASPPEVRVAIESADCLLCVGVRFTDTATGFFSHRLRSEALINIRAFDVTVGTTHVPGVAGFEVLSALVKAVRVKLRRILPPRLQPPNRLPSQFRQSLTQDRFWQRIQDFIRPGDVILADVGTSSAGTAGLRMPNGVAVIGQPLWAAVGYSLPALLGTLLAAPLRR